MAGKSLRYLIALPVIIAALAVVTWLAWVTSPDLKFNAASFEDEPLQLQVAPLEQALTLAQYRFGTAHSGGIATLLVTDYSGHGGNSTVTGVDLASLDVVQARNPFEVAAGITPEVRARVLAGEGDVVTKHVDELLPIAPRGTRHIGIGTNFPEHAEEANSDSVFNFPKFGVPTRPRTSIKASPEDLLDYEVELCLRFDRPIASVADFDAAMKGLFLCADFTDRIALVELADTDNLDSGYGFSDAKSGKGFYPSGPLLVIPNDWKSFIADVRMATEVNGEPRQDARGGEMILDFRQLVEKVLADMSEPRFYYQGEFYKLVPEGVIGTDTTLMSGTSEGVIFTAPARHDYIEIALSYLLDEEKVKAEDFMDYAKARFIESERASGHFLKPGDVVIYRASVLGDIVVEVLDK